MKHRRTPLASGILFGLASILFSWTLSSPAQEADQQAALNLARLNVNGTNALASPTSEASFEVKEDKSLLTAQFGIDFGSQGNSSLQLRLSGKLEGEELELANLEDLPGGIKGELAFTQAFSVGAGASLTGLCREVNERLRASVPAHDPKALTSLKRARASDGKERYGHYLDAARLELAVLDLEDFPDVQTLEAVAVADSCKEWNKGRLENLLIDPVFGQGATKIAFPGTDDCNIENLVELSATEAAEKQGYVKRQPNDRLIDTTSTTCKISSTPAVDQKVKDAAEATCNEIYKKIAKVIATEIGSWSKIDLPFLRKRPDEIVDIACSYDELLAVAASLPRRERGKLYRKASRALPSMAFITLGYSNASQDFKHFTDPPSIDDDTGLTFDIKKENEHNQSTRLGFSLFSKGWLLTVGGSEKRTWKAAPEAELCLPVTDGEALTCATSSIGPPTRRATNVFDFQAKTQFSQTFAILGQVFFEDEEDILNPHAILYFLPKDKKLRGGVDFGYVDNSPRPDENGFTARLFVGTPFSMKP